MCQPRFRAMVVWVMALAIPAISLAEVPAISLAEESVAGSGGPLAALLPSLDLAKLATDGGHVLVDRRASDQGERRRLSAASSTQREAQRNSRWGPRLYLSAALTISAAVLARWTEHEADRSYDKYLQSAGPKRQQTSFDRAKHYDRLSGAALVTMEAGLVLSTYLVFF